MNLSLGEVTKNINLIGNISVKRDIFNMPNLPSLASLRLNLLLLDAVFRFAPEVRLHPDDIYKPSSVSWYLKRVHLRLDIVGGSDKQILDKGKVTQNKLIQHAGGEKRSMYFLQIPNDDDEETTRKGYLRTADCYVHFRPVPHSIDTFDIQYWFFYPYNGGMGPDAGAHEGDWEHITVRINSRKIEIEKIFYAAHADEGIWYPKSSVNTTDSNRPIVYSAKHSHASYPTAGEQKRSGANPNDETKIGGQLWRCWERIVIVGERNHVLNGQNWLKYSGRWGEIGKRLPVTVAKSDGPYGPAFKSSWLEDLK